MTETILLTILAGQFAAAAMLPVLLWQTWWGEALRGAPPDADHPSLQQPATGTSSRRTPRRRDPQAPARPARRDRAARKRAAVGSKSRPATAGRRGGA